MSDLKPTPEQSAIIEAFKTGDDLVAEAGAGTGKTSTLKLMAAETTRKGVYIAYNKAIATDAKKSFPDNVTCATAHSFAFRAVGKDYASRLNGPRVMPSQVADILDIDRSFPIGGGKELSTWTIARLAMDTVNRFCYSADARPMPRHAPMVPGAEEVSYELADYLATLAAKAWYDLSKTSGKLRFQHDHYLKLWALGNPRLPGDFILFDEAQDANPVIADLILKQDGAQKIAVGDRCQAIYGWRGAQDAMQGWPAKHRLLLSQSFRFGSAVADEANKWLALLGGPLRLKGFDQIASEVTTLTRSEADAILCRTNAAVISNALSLPADSTFAVVGGTDQIRRFADAADSLMQGRGPKGHPELLAFKNWQQVCEYVDENEEGRDLRVMVNLVRDFGSETIRGIADRAVAREDDADVVLSTAHKAKGREWDNVLIANDFAPSEDTDDLGGERELSKSEMMLAYVAVTRAQRKLDCSALDFVNDLIASTAHSSDSEGGA